MPYFVLTQEQQIKCLPVPKTLKPNDCSNDTIITITESINIINNINITSSNNSKDNIDINVKENENMNMKDNIFDNNSITNTTVNSSNINVKISTINPNNIIYTNKSNSASNSNSILTELNPSPSKFIASDKSISSIPRPQPSILRTTSHITTTTSPSKDIDHRNHHQIKQNQQMNKYGAHSALNLILRPSSSEPPPSTSTQRDINEQSQILAQNGNNEGKQAQGGVASALYLLKTPPRNTNTILHTLSTSPPHYPPPQLSMYNNANTHSHSTIFTHSQEPRTHSLSFDGGIINSNKNNIDHLDRDQINKEITDQHHNEITNNSSASSAHSSQNRRIMLMDDDQEQSDSSNDEIMIVHPSKAQKTLHLTINTKPTKNNESLSIPTPNPFDYPPSPNNNNNHRRNPSESDMELFRKQVEQQRDRKGTGGSNTSQQVQNSSTPKNLDVFTPALPASVTPSLFNFTTDNVNNMNYDPYSESSITRSMRAQQTPHGTVNNHFGHPFNINNSISRGLKGSWSKENVALGITTPELNAVVDQHHNEIMAKLGTHNPNEKATKINKKSIANHSPKDLLTKSNSSSPKKPIVSIKWPKGDPSALATGHDPYYRHPRVSWSESDIKYPLKWLINQHQSNKQHKKELQDKKKRDKEKKKKNKRQLKSIHAPKSKAKTKHKSSHSPSKHAKITLQPMDENMDSGTDRTQSHSKIKPSKIKARHHRRSNESLSRSYKKPKPSLSNVSSLSISQSHSKSRTKTKSKKEMKMMTKSQRKRRKHFSLTEHDDMGSIDETGALIHSSSGSASQSSSDTEEYQPPVPYAQAQNDDASSLPPIAKISSAPRSQSISVNGNTPLSFDEINNELNSGKTSRVISMDSSLSINIQNTNTKLFDTLRKLSSQQSKESNSSAGTVNYNPGHNKNKKSISGSYSYHNVPTQIRHRLSIEEDEEEGVDLLDHGHAHSRSHLGIGNVQTHIMVDNSSDDSVHDRRRSIPVPKLSMDTQYNNDTNDRDLEMTSTKIMTENVQKKKPKQMKQNKNRNKNKNKNKTKKKKKKDRDKNSSSKKKSKSKHQQSTSLLTQSYTPNAGHGMHVRSNSCSRPLSHSLVDTENEDQGLHTPITPNLNRNLSPAGQGHKLRNSDTLNTMSSMTPTVTHSLLMHNNGTHGDNTLYNVGCNIDD